MYWYKIKNKISCSTSQKKNLLYTFTFFCPLIKNSFLIYLYFQIPGAFHLMYSSVFSFLHFMICNHFKDSESRSKTFLDQLRTLWPMFYSTLVTVYDSWLQLVTEFVNLWNLWQLVTVDYSLWQVVRVKQHLTVSWLAEDTGPKFNSTAGGVFE